VHVTGCHAPYVPAAVFSKSIKFIRTTCVNKLNVKQLIYKLLEAEKDLKSMRGLGYIQSSPVFFNLPHMYNCPPPL
jgi:hypothetical protein